MKCYNIKFDLTFLFVNLFLFVVIAQVETEKPFAISNFSFVQNAKKFVVAEHNKLRSGLEMTWSSKAEQEAVLMSQKCNFDQISKQTKPKHHIFLTQGKVPIKRFIKTAIEKWNSEKLFRQPKSKFGFPAKSAWATEYTVGCSLTTCANIPANNRVLKVGQMLLCVYDLFL